LAFVARRGLLNEAYFFNAAMFANIAQTLAVLAQQRAALPSLSRVASVTSLSPARLRRHFLDWSGIELDLLLNACEVIGDEEGLIGEARLFAAAHALHLRGQDRLRHCIVDLKSQIVDAGRWRGSLHWGCSRSPFGDCVIAWTDAGLCHLEFFDHAEDSLRFLTERWDAAQFERDDIEAARKVLAVFEGKSLALHLVGSAFQLEVWRALVARDSGETVTYGELASAVSRPRAARAVGTAVGSNRIGWLVPCHHVVRSDGGLGGFHWGVDRKRAMLVWESIRPG
jgi:AraC family transcriptional regulator of adaptative response/methylated-DNA-[protein]-cysteine methyltransferase